MHGIKTVEIAIGYYCCIVELQQISLFWDQSLCFIFFTISVRNTFRPNKYSATYTPGPCIITSRSSDTVTATVVKFSDKVSASVMSSKCPPLLSCRQTKCLLLSCLHTKYRILGYLLPELDICWHSLMEFYISSWKFNRYFRKYSIETIEQTWHCEQMHILIFTLSTSKKDWTNFHSSFQLVVFPRFLQKFKIFLKI